MSRTPGDHTMVRTRLYFTSESHLHTLINVLRHPPAKGLEPFLSPAGVRVLEKAPELCFMTHVVFRVFKAISSDKFRLEILFSPGADGDPFETLPSSESPGKPNPFSPVTAYSETVSNKANPTVAPLVPLLVEKSPKDLEEFLSTAMKMEDLE
ncbi:unnamed protein product [Choristocarpus tenellus]